MSVPQKKMMPSPIVTSEGQDNHTKISSVFYNDEDFLGHQEAGGGPFLSNLGQIEKLEKAKARHVKPLSYAVPKTAKR
jgi:hypothetical protein